MLSHEAAESTTKVGLGHSIAVGIGRDKLSGTTLADGLRFFFNHKKTKRIIVIGEIGSEAELKAADLIKGYRRATPNPKSIIAMVAADGAFPSSKRNIYAEAKVKALEDASAVVVPHPGVMGQTMMELLGKR
ncbi:unnamed protein product [Clonostachys byssicola]|uniref:ATP-citrate synthase/succinyl-CoA ligase C-terminal domain-containing protein n=1 Tax=Clonostachys byssicola TaxID=160290 RepID=A0A9N9Y019_9HYPO|nr:unnamed protein product [Clonostachys byssicola]